MDIYIIRHADALALGERGITQDADRPLSEEGEAQARAVGAGLRRRDIQVDKIVTSPLLRARQTAEGILRAWETPAPQFHVCAHLIPGNRPKKLGKFLRELGGEQIALVGHQPHLGQFIAWLIGGKEGQFDLAKAGVAYVHCEEPRKGSGVLRWMVTPEWLG